MEICLEFGSTATVNCAVDIADHEVYGRTSDRGRESGLDYGKSRTMIVNRAVPASKLGP